MSDRYEEGMRVRREVLGDEHVDRAVSATTALDSDFQRWITESVWGELWANPGLDRRTRSLVTIAILAALRSEELELPLKASVNTGVTNEELDVRDGEIEPLRAGRRNDVRGVSREEQPAEPHGLGDEAPQRCDRFFDRRTGDEPLRGRAR